MKCKAVWINGFGVSEIGDQAVKLTLPGITTFNKLRRHRVNLRNRNALLTTETELKLMAAAATIGLSKSPNTG